MVMALEGRLPAPQIGCPESFASASQAKAPQLLVRLQTLHFSRSTELAKKGRWYGAPIPIGVVKKAKRRIAIRH